MENHNECRTLIYLIRHGESEGNAKKILLGHTDLGLTELGLKQARITAQALAEVRFDAIYSSDLKRAMQTAAPHAEIRGNEIEIVPDKGLRELYCGDWEGLTVEELLLNHREQFEDHWHAAFGTFRMPGGESVPELAERINDTLLRIARAHVGQTVLCTTHAAAIRSFWGLISGIAPDAIVGRLPFPSNASYSIVEFLGDKLVPVSYSCDEHLAKYDMITRI